MSAPPLSGRAIVVTRPVAQAGRLCQLIDEAGGEAVAFPTVEILSTFNESLVHTWANKANLINIDCVVFVSPTAVEQGLAALQWVQGATAARSPDSHAGVPGGVRVAAVGRGTAAALARRGFRDVLFPADGADSEALAALPALSEQAIAGRAILIVRGEGGREWLADTLRTRGARVETMACYRRVKPAVDDSLAAAMAARWRSGGIDAAAVHSRGAFDNLLDLLPSDVRPRVLATPLFALHERIAAHARSLGSVAVMVAGPGDEQMVAGMQVFFAKVAP